MRNIFDQYSQPENRVTHALVTALHEDRDLLRAFLADIANCSPPKAKNTIEICEQTYPGKLEAAEEETERRGIPDAWITAGEDWCLVLENKVLDAATNKQLSRHLSTAKRFGFTDPRALVLTIRKTVGKMPDGTRVVEWRTVYRWLIDRAPKSPWAGRVAEFLELMEGRMVDQQQLTAGTLTAFNGFPFDRDNPFSYLEAKRVLGLAIKELRNRTDLKSALGMASDLPGRKAITGRSEDRIWDYLQIEAAREAETFTKYPHLTLGIGHTEVEAMITVPDGIRRQSLRRMKDLGTEGFRGLVHDVLERMRPTLLKCEGMEPRLRALQRRYRTQSSVPFHDAVLDFDLRTGFEGERPLRTQPQWVEAIYEVLANKNSNLQIQFGAYFPYRTCEAIRTVEALDHIAAAWISCRPLIELLVTDDPV